MQRTFLGAAMAVAFSAALAAQSSTVKTETKVEVKDGKDVVVTGCLDRAASGTGYTLIDAEGRDVTSTAFMLVGYHCANRPWYRSRIVVPASALIASTAVYWTIERLSF